MGTKNSAKLSAQQLFICSVFEGFETNTIYKTITWDIYLRKFHHYTNLKFENLSFCASMSEAAWKDLHALLQFGIKFEQLIDNIVKQPKEWEVWFFSHKLELPSCLNV